ncbi:4Fe-4S binding protein [Candidatus Bathyarchaeota archaeon]|nr:4Fe-4S binding protein [Candidatus Bathyarchaeota archaeon]
MRQIAVLSGKGGTGKTTITSSFAVLAERSVVADCDVDAPDLHILLHPSVYEREEFKGSSLAIIDESRCIRCGSCREWCRFNAITEDLKVDPYSCEGCGVCALICPVQAVDVVSRISGYIYTSNTRYGFMVHGLLNPGEANSGKLVALIRERARRLAEEENCEMVIIDGPPGIGCPVIASVGGVDIGLIITEPTLSGMHDLERALQLLLHFKVKPLVCINMYDINVNNTEGILSFCREKDIEVVGKIPFNEKVTEAMVNGKTIIEFYPECDVSIEIKGVWEAIKSILR